MSRLLSKGFRSRISILGLFFLFNGASWASSLVEVSGSDLVQDKEVTFRFSEAQKATVVAFLSTRCPCSASHQSVLNQLTRDFGTQGFRFVGIHSNANEDLKEAREFFGKSGLAFPVVHDPHSKLADQLKAFKTPHVFVVSPKAEVLFEGGVDNSKSSEKATQHYLKEALAAISLGKNPPEKAVRVLGCEIKRP